MTRKSRKVDAFIDAMVHGSRPPRFRVKPEEVDVLSAAVEMAALRSGDAAPDPAFLQRLERELRRDVVPETPRRPRSVSRRRLLETAGLAVAAGALGAVSERLIAAPAKAPATDLVPDKGSWHTVARLDALTPGRVMPFTTPTVAGFVHNREGQIIAVSGVCTHQGCLLQLDRSNQLQCPCHRAAFSANGDVISHELDFNLPSLPKLATRIHDGDVQVLVPTPL
jgi:cytochrome b6-f complex iron-sulfur subunit